MESIGGYDSVSGYLTGRVLEGMILREAIKP